MLLSSIKVDLEGPDPTQNKNAINQKPKMIIIIVLFLQSSFSPRALESKASIQERPETRLQNDPIKRSVQLENTHLNTYMNLRTGVYIWLSKSPL